MNTHAQALGRKAKGKLKTITPAESARRRASLALARQSRWPGIHPETQRLRLAAQLARNAGQPVAAQILEASAAREYNGQSWPKSPIVVVADLRPLLDV